MDMTTVFHLIRTELRTDDSGTTAVTVTERRKRYGKLSSVTMRESYAAMSVGHNPEIKLTLPEASDYRNERYALVDGSVYVVLRVYLTGSGVELTLERTRDLEGMV